MKLTQNVFTILFMSLGLFGCREDDINTETNNDKYSSFSLDEVSNGDGVYVISGDAELTWSVLGTHFYNSVMKQVCP